MAAESKPKDWWDKITVLLHPVGGLLTAFAVAFVGMRGSQLLERRQSLDTNARLYSELMSRREEAESSLRKDMLVSIISQYLRPSDNDLDAKVLNLELLAYNFHDSLDLRPLFFDLQRRIRRSSNADRNELQTRIESVAKEITAKQLFALEGHGQTFRREVDMDALRDAGKAGIPLDAEPIAVRDVACDVKVRVLTVDPDAKQLRVRLEVEAPEGQADLPVTRAEFDVSYFDFPMIDNTRLANGLRCAVTLANFSAAGANLTTVCFPGEYASLKDRPYYDEVIQKLREANADPDAPAGPTAPARGSSSSTTP
ncbi:MAG TPA: hypothetical protein VFB67_13060 [Candidatus Polarisedimenticolaceae bacterium]|nr:hypothetical protein [Candidatus Polarisedimenticolaceae bacterium]